MHLPQRCMHIAISRALLDEGLPTSREAAFVRAIVSPGRLASSTSQRIF
jgi:hypothetical protein